MPLLDYLTFQTMQKVENSGGTIFYDRLRSTAGGVGTARTSISTTYAIPQRASAIIALSPSMLTASPGAAEATAGVHDIIGNNFGYQPIELFCPIGGPKLGAIEQLMLTPQEWWCVKIPVTPQATYDWGTTAFDAIAGNYRAFMDIMYAAWPGVIKSPAEVKALLGPPINSLAQRQQTITAATAGDIAGGTLTLADACELVEYAGLALPAGVVVTLEELVFDITIRSDALTPIQQFRAGVASSQAMIGVSGQNTNSELTRLLTPGLSFTNKTPTVTFTGNVDVAITNAGIFASLLRYLKSP